MSFLSIRVIFIALNWVYARSQIADLNLIVTWSIPEEGKYNGGIYYIDREMATPKERFGSSDPSEELLEILQVGSFKTEHVMPESSFVYRSGDFYNRIRITIGMNRNFETARPFAITFANMNNLNDRDAGFPMEIQHSNGGYFWLEPGSIVKHITAENHIFTIRDADNQCIFRIVIKGIVPHPEEQSPASPELIQTVSSPSQSVHPKPSAPSSSSFLVGQL